MSRARVVLLPDNVCSPTHPPTGGPGFVCLSGLLSPRRGGRCRSPSPPGPGESETMGSAVPFGTVRVRHTQFELHDLSCFGAVSSYPLAHQWDPRPRPLDGRCGVGPQHRSPPSEERCRWGPIHRRHHAPRSGATPGIRLRRRRQHASPRGAQENRRSPAPDKAPADTPKANPPLIPESDGLGLWSSPTLPSPSLPQCPESFSSTTSSPSSSSNRSVHV